MQRGEQDAKSAPVCYLQVARPPWRIAPGAFAVNNMAKPDSLLQRLTVMYGDNDRNAAFSRDRQ